MIQVALIDEGLTLIQRRLDAPFGPWVCRYQSIAAAGHWKQQGDSHGMKKHLCLIEAEAAFDADISKQHVFAVSAARKWHSEEVPDGAVRAVAADQIVAVDFYSPASGKLDASGDAVRFLVKRHNLNVAFDEDVVAASMLFQETLGLVLRYRDNKGISGVEPIELNPGNALSFTDGLYASDGIAFGKKLARNAYQLEDFHRSGQNGNSSGSHRPIRRFVDQTASNPMTRKLVRHNQAGRTGTCNQNCRHIRLMICMRWARCA